MNVLQAGVADVDKANIEGNTPLHIACKTGPTELHMCQFSFKTENICAHVHSDTDMQVWRKRFIFFFLWQRRTGRVLTYKTTKER